MKEGNAGTQRKGVARGLNGVASGLNRVARGLNRVARGLNRVARGLNRVARDLKGRERKERREGKEGRVGPRHNTRSTSHRHIITVTSYNQHNIITSP